MKKKVYAYLHTHWDREWYREFEEFRTRLIEVFDDILKKLENEEIPAFYFDGQTSALEDYLEIKPENKDKIKKLIKDKRLFIGPFYCSTDSFLVDTESILKNLQLGIEYSKAHNCHEFIAYHADTFGHSKFITEIIKYFEIPHAIFWRGLGEKPSEFLFNKLKSIYLIEGYFHDYLSVDADFNNKAKMFEKTLDRIAKYSSKDILLPLGADHLALANNIKEQINQINQKLNNYEIILSTPFEYIEKVKNNFKIDYNEEQRSSKRNFILSGVYSSRIDLKQKNTTLQWQISRLVQPLQAICSFLNYSKNFQSEVNHAQKKLIQNHPHDSIYGCSTDKVHQENLSKYAQVEQACNAIINSTIRDLNNSNDIAIINLSSYPQNGAIKLKTTNKLNKKFNAQLIKKEKGFPLQKLYNINQIPITEDYTNIYEYLIDTKNIEPLTIKTLTDKNLNKNSTLKITQSSLENDNIKLEVTSSSINVTDKKNKITYKNFVNITDLADIGDSYNFGALKNDKPIYAKIISSKIAQKGHIQSCLQIKLEIRIPQNSTDKGRSLSTQKHIINLIAKLQNQNNFIEFNINWNNKSKNHLLQLEFNLNNPITQVTSDDLTGYITRNFDPNYDIYKKIPAPKGIELMLNTAPIQKSLLVQNFGIITKGIQEYEVKQNKLKLTLLRATGIISNPHNPTRGTPAGPPLETPHLQMLGTNARNIAICFANKIEDLEPNIEKFYNTSMLIETKVNQNEKLFEFNPKINITTIKTNHANDLIIRFVNKTNTKEKLNFTTTLNNKGIYITDALENIVKKYNNETINANSLLTLLIKNTN